MAHRGQELALGLVGGLGGFLGFAQILFRLQQFLGQSFQLVVGFRQFAGPRFGGRRPLGDALFQGLVESLQLLEAFGVFQGRAGERGDEVGQPFFVGAEQADAPGRV